MKVVIAGGGWAGCAAAASARKQGVDVTLLERTDLLLGTGLVGGIMRNNGRFTATEEAIAMGGDDLFHITDAYARHKDVSFPGHAHASLYDICKTPVAVTDHMLAIGVDVKLCSRITSADMEGRPSSAFTPTTAPAMKVPCLSMPPEPPDRRPIASSMATAV